MSYNNLEIFNEEELFNTLEDYQKEIINEIGYSEKDSEEIAEIWLNASTSNTVAFGTRTGKKIFYENIKKEVIRFICDENSYVNERQKLFSKSDITHAFFINILTTAIAPVVGTSATFLTPVIVLFLISVGNVTKNAFCL